VAGWRPEFFLADLVAIIALGGLVLALVLQPVQSASAAGIFFLIVFVLIAWKILRVMREAPACEECGRRLMPPRQIASPTLCPECGQPQPGTGRSHKALVIGFWAVLALLLLAGVLILLLSMDLVRSPRALVSWDALGFALPLGLKLLLVLFSVLFIARFLEESAGVKPGPCENCRSIKLQEGATGLLICPRCRLRHLPEEQLPKEQARGTWNILALLQILGLLVGFMLAGFVDSHYGMNYWIAVPLVIVATTVGLPAVLIAVLALLSVVRVRRLRAEPFILASARKAAGEEGEVVTSGPAIVWYSGPINPVSLLMEQMGATRSRLESLLGRGIVNQPPLRILCFRKRSAFQAFLKPVFAQLSNWLKTLDGIYIMRPHRILALCSDEVPYRALDLDRTGRTLFCHYFFLEESPGNPRAAWLRGGVSRILTSDLDDHARLNRKMLVSLSRGTTLGTDLFKHDDKELLKLYKGWSDHRNFAKLEQFSAESWSVCEYLGGEQAPAQRRECFRAFLNDSQSSAQLDEVFERHFGFGLGRLCDSWHSGYRNKLTTPFHRSGRLSGMG